MLPYCPYNSLSMTTSTLSAFAFVTKFSNLLMSPVFATFTFNSLLTHLTSSFHSHLVIPSPSVFFYHFTIYTTNSLCQHLFFFFLLRYKIIIPRNSPLSLSTLPFSYPILHMMNIQHSLVFCLTNRSLSLSLSLSPRVLSMFLCLIVFVDIVEDE